MVAPILRSAGNLMRAAQRRPGGVTPDRLYPFFTVTFPTVTGRSQDQRSRVRVQLRRHSARGPSSAPGTIGAQIPSRKRSAAWPPTAIAPFLQVRALPAWCEDLLHSHFKGAPSGRQGGPGGQGAASPRSRVRQPPQAARSRRSLGRSAYPLCRHDLRSRVPSPSEASTSRLAISRRHREA